MRKQLLQAGYALAIFLIFPFCSMGTHFMGGDIGWKCLGKDTFLINIVIYRDCASVPISDQDITLTDCKRSSVTLPGSIKLISSKDITPVCKGSCTQCGKTTNMNPGNTSCKFGYGIEQFVYQHKIIFNKKTYFDLSFK